MREGPQPPACALQSCDNPPANGMVGYCPAHAAQFANGSAVTPPIVQPDDPELLERVAKKAAEQEAKEYAERRRVKSWRTLENGTRVPEEYWSDEELEAIEAEVAANMNMSVANDLIGEIYDPDGRISAARAAAPDPVKEATKIFKAALKGKLGELAREHAWSTVRLLADLR